MSSKLAPFYVGQKVVCVKTLIASVLVKGNNYTVTGVFKKSCGCGYQITVGILSPSDKSRGTRCCNCNKVNEDKTFEWPFNSACFAPIEKQNLPLITLTQIQTKELEKEQVKEYDKQLIGGN